MKQSGQWAHLWAGTIYLYFRVTRRSRTSPTTLGRVKIIGNCPESLLQCLRTIGSAKSWERLNTTIAEGYPSRAQDSVSLKKDQFVKMLKTQSQWYQMHTLRPDGLHRPGKSLFSWSNSEAKVNSQFPRIRSTF